jgi:hypothetical protein
MTWRLILNGTSSCFLMYNYPSSGQELYPMYSII